MLDAYATRGRFKRRNVHLTWAARHATWVGPGYEPYDAMLAHRPKIAGLRVLGECWGMSSISHPAEGGAVLVTGVRRAPRAGRVQWAPNGTDVRCFLGATFRDVNDFLDAESGYNLRNQPGFEGLTVAGNIGVGGHGSGLNVGPLGSMVTRIELAAVNGSPRPFEAFERGHPAFDCVLAHLGRLGPVVAIDLEVRRRYRIAETRELWELGERTGSWREELQALLDEAVLEQEKPGTHSAEIWLAPYPRNGRIRAAYGLREFTDEPLSKHKRPLGLRWRIVHIIAMLLSAFAALLAPFLMRWALRVAVGATATKRVVLDPRRALDFGAGNGDPMASVEMSVNISERADASAVIAVIEALEELTKKGCRGRYIYSPIGLRFSGTGPRHGLAPQSGWARTMHIELPTWNLEWLFHCDDVLKPIQEMLARDFGARPHWGQRIYLSARALARLWPRTELDRMRRIARRLDPQRIFANRLLDRMMRPIKAPRAAEGSRSRGV